MDFWKVREIMTKVLAKVLESERKAVVLKTGTRGDLQEM